MSMKGMRAVAVLLLERGDALLDGRVGLSPGFWRNNLRCPFSSPLIPRFLFALISCMRNVLELLLTSIYAHDSVSLGAFVTHKLDAEHTNSRNEFFYNRIRK